MRLKHIKDYALSPFLSLCRAFFRIVKTQKISQRLGERWLLDSIIPMHRSHVYVSHTDAQTQARLFRGVRVHAPLLVAIQTPFFVIYDNTYAVGRITSASGRRRRSGFV